MDVNAIQQRQQEIRTIGFMKKGSITRQRMPAAQGGAGVEAGRGPYPLLTWKEKGRTKSMRLTTPEAVAWAEAAVANHRRFAQLVREYEELGERLALAQQHTQAVATEKKTPKSPRKRKPK